ncbi:MAG: hypothetical protein ACI4VS_02665 [Candidatus Nanosyncoccaceae bacterium]
MIIDPDSLIIDSRTIDIPSIIAYIIVLVVGVTIGAMLLIKNRKQHLKLGILQIVLSIFTPLLMALYCCHLKSLWVEFYVSDLEVLMLAIVKNMSVALSEFLVALYILLISVSTLSIEAIIKTIRKQK